jgi:competence protein ComEA
MDSNPMPWRTIEASSTIAPTENVEPSGTSRRPGRGTAMVVAATGLVALAAFLLAFGSGASGALDVAGGGPLGSNGVTDASGVDPLGSVVPEPGSIVVEIVGAVAKPGVYTLPTGSRVGALVDAAGGYGPRVDAARASRDLHLASVLSDGDQVRVPSRDDSEASATDPATGGNGSARPTPSVDINQATPDQLDALPGIGPVTADKIIASRGEARFTAVADLLTRKLVGQKTFDGLKDLVTVR